MKRRRLLFFHFGKIRRLVKKFAIAILFITAFVLMLLNKTENVILEKTSTVANDFMSPAIDVLLVPAKVVAGAYDYFRELKQIHKDNKNLKEENRRLLEMKDQSRALEIENKILSSLLNYIPPPDATYISARVIAEEGDAFSHSLIVYIGDNDKVRKGQVVLGENGVVGRVDKVGESYAKVIMITDINSKIPVMAERTRVRGILSGDNTPIPKMIFIPLVAEIAVGDRVITSGVAGTFPPGLPIGTISSIEKNNVKVKAFSNFDKLEYVRIVDYGLIDITTIKEEDGIESVR